jgi:hypothetical protein
MFVWVFITTGGVTLTWSAILKRNDTCMAMRGFSILMGLLGTLLAS